MDLVFENVTVTYDKGGKGLLGVSFTAKGGEVTLLLGEKGSGKTTAMFSCCGIQDITEGKITLGDRTVSGVSPRETNALYCGPETALPGGRTVKEDIARPLILRGMDKKEAADRALKVLKEFGLEGISGKKNKDLLPGEKEMVFLMSGYARGAELFMFNMPAADSDFARAAALCASRTGAPVLLALNNAGQITEEYAPSSVILRDGEILTAKSTGEIRREPQSVYEMCIMSRCSVIREADRTVCFELADAEPDEGGGYSGTSLYCDGRQSLIRINPESPCITLPVRTKPGDTVHFSVSKVKSFAYSVEESKSL